jgi:hypothetical protein
MGGFVRPLRRWLRLIVRVTYGNGTARLDPGGQRRHDDRGEEKDLTPDGEQRRGEPDDGLRLVARNSRFSLQRSPHRRHSICRPE